MNFMGILFYSDRGEFPVERMSATNASGECSSNEFKGEKFFTPME